MDAFKEFFNREMETVSLKLTKDQYKMMHSMAKQQDLLAGEMITLLIHAFLIDLTPSILQYRDAFWQFIVDEHQNMITVGVDLPPDYLKVITHLGDVMDIDLDNMGSCIIYLQTSRIGQQFSIDSQASKN